MKNLTSKAALRLAVALTVLLCAGCATDAEIAVQTAKYTSETAQAIAAAGWRLSGAIFGGIFLHALIS